MDAIAAKITKRFMDIPLAGVEIAPTIYLPTRLASIDQSGLLWERCGHLISGEQFARGWEGVHRATPAGGSIKRLRSIIWASGVLCLNWVSPRRSTILARQRAQKTLSQHTLLRLHLLNAGWHLACEALPALRVYPRLHAPTLPRPSLPTPQSNSHSLRGR